MMRKPWLAAVWIGCQAIGGLCAPAAPAPPREPAMAEVEKNFRELPMEARRLTGPLFWLHGDETKERLEMYIEKIAEGGNGSFTAESRPHKDWLGEGWYRDLAICLAAAKKHNLQMWIFDEAWWPSQMVGGKVPPEYGAKTMAAEDAAVEGPKRFTAAGYGGPRFIGAVAGKVVDKEIDGSSLVDLAPHIRNGELTWDAPAGSWRVMKFSWTHTGAKGMQKKWVSVDGASPDCVDWFLKFVYQPHYDRFKSDFGKTIPGYFYDEPETQGDWGTAVMTVLAERKVDWKKALVAWKYLLVGDEYIAAKYQYADAFAEAWGRTMYGGMSKWCEERQVVSMGHFMEHNTDLFSRRLCAGNIFQLQKYSGMGGIDLVCRQYYPGQRRVGLFQMPKLGSSISHVYGKKDDVAMCEMFGGYNQNLTYPQMKWLTDQMQARGTSFMIPHSFNPRAPFDKDFPPYFYNGGFEPRWPLYRVYADYTSRLSLMLTGGRHVAPVAFLFLGQSYHAGQRIRPDELTDALDDAIFDCDWVPYDAFESSALEGKEIRLHGERYRVLIVPAAETIPYETLAKARRFFDRGGIVLGYGHLPARSATLGKTSADIATEVAAIWGAGAAPGAKACKTNAAGGRSYFLPERCDPELIRNVLAGDAGVRPAFEVVKGETNNWLHVLHRVKSGRDVFLVCNQNHEGGARRFTFRVRAAGEPECWDAMRNEIVAASFMRVAPNEVELDLTLEPSESVLLVFQEKSRPLPRREPEGPPGGAAPARTVAIGSDPSVKAEPDPVPSPDGKQKPTLSPVKGNVFQGRCELPADVDLSKGRAILELDALEPEEAAHVTVNGAYAGGFIGRPFRLDVTKHLRPGENKFRISPFAPKSARLTIVER